MTVYELIQELRKWAPMNEVRIGAEAYDDDAPDREVITIYHANAYGVDYVVID